jgi:hypothetical protein
MSTPKVTDKEVELLRSLLSKVVWSDRLTREKIQQSGVNVTPVNFYSNTPSIEDIKNSYEYNEAQAPYLSETLFGEAILSQTLKELTSYSEEFDPATEGDEQKCERFFWKNSQFSYSDAMSYYCFVRNLKPKTIVEIGSGFSTLVAIEAVAKNASGSIICIEPFPRPFLESNKNIVLRREKAQDLNADSLNQLLQDGDILFIDSTHTVKTGSDCLHIYLRLLPKIKRNINVHVHDVFLPFGLPMDWLLDKQIFWTEQYLLLALLTDNPKSRVLYGSAYHYAFNKEALDRMMDNKYPSGGASFWFEYRGGN